MKKIVITICLCFASGLVGNMYLKGLGGEIMMTMKETKI